MNIRALQYFVALADLRNFSRAAEACFVTQPTLSIQIRKLEDELGVQLIERTPRKIMLTEVGIDIAERASEIIHDIDQLKAIARRATDPGAGILRLGIFPTLAPYLLPHIVPGIRKAFPKLQLQMFEEKTADVLQLLKRGKLDAGILALPIDEEQLNFKVLFDEPFVAAMPVSHPLADSKYLYVNDLRGQDLLLLEEGHCLRDHALEVCSMVGATEKLNLQATSLETLRMMVAADVGITLLPVLSVKPPVPKTENLALRPFHPPEPKRTLVLCWRRSSAMADFFEQLADLIRQLPEELLTTNTGDKL
ncbi:MAG: LysR substrate-binding domain-containing protein [Xanthomonadales bacterium]|nr:LysR substrate-binding domain-containing protein [Xanthomonadales bacterium]